MVLIELFEQLMYKERDHFLHDMYLFHEWHYQLHNYLLLIFVFFEFYHHIVFMHYQLQCFNPDFFSNFILELIKYDFDELILLTYWIKNKLFVNKQPKSNILILFFFKKLFRLHYVFCSFKRKAKYIFIIRILFIRNFSRWFVIYFFVFTKTYSICIYILNKFIFLIRVTLFSFIKKRCCLINLCGKIIFNLELLTWI